MPKMKTHKGTKKRTSVTGTGKIKRSKAYRKKHLSRKSAKTKRTLRKAGYVATANEKTAKLLMPYS